MLAGSAMIQYRARRGKRIGASVTALYPAKDTRSTALLTGDAPVVTCRAKPSKRNRTQRR